MKISVDSWTVSRASEYIWRQGSLKIDGGAERFRDSTGGGVGFVSPAGRVRGRRRVAPTAFVVAAAGRSVAEGRALRADTKRRGAPFTKTRVRGTRKCQGRSSRHENASPCYRYLGPRRVDLRWLSTNDHELTRILFIFVKFVLIRGQQIMGGLSWRGRRGSLGDRPWREILKFVEKKMV